MDKLKFEFTVKAAEDPATSIICITSITDTNKQTFILPDEIQPVRLHEQITKTDIYKSVKNTLQRRHEKRQVWISLTPEIRENYMDEHGNMQFKGYLLEQILPGTQGEASSAGLSEAALSRILEKYFERKRGTGCPKISLRQLSETFVIDKFSKKITNVSQWMMVFEEEFARMGIEEDLQKIETLKLFLDDGPLVTFYRTHYVKLYAALCQSFIYSVPPTNVNWAGITPL